MAALPEEISFDGSDSDTVKSSPMSQRDYYQHVSGAGDGHALETTASPMMKQMVVSPLASTNSFGYETDEPELIPDSSPRSSWSKTLNDFQLQVETVLGSIDKEKIDLSFGQKVILRDQPTFLDLTKIDDQTVIDPIDPDSCPDGLVVFLSIRFKKDYQTDASEIIQDIIQRTGSSQSQTEDEDRKRLSHSPDEKTSDDDRTLYPTDEHEDDDVEGEPNMDRPGSNSRKSSGGSQKSGSKRSTPDSVKSRSPRLEVEVDDKMSVAGSECNNVEEYEEYEEEIINDDGSTEIITKRRLKPLPDSRSLSRQQRGSRDSQLSGSHRSSRNGNYVEKDDFAEQSQLGDDEIRRIEMESQRHDRLNQKRLQRTVKKHGRSYSLEECGRHESCFEEFEGYDENYSGPKGILSSKLPDGSSTIDYDPLYVPNDDPSIQITRIGNVTYRSRDPVAALAHSLRYPKTPQECTPFRISLPQLSNGSKLIASKAPQVPNRVRRLRSRHVELDKNAWFVGSTPCSFNSRCSSRFDLTELETGSRQYYYFRSLPRLAHQESTESTFGSQFETPGRRGKLDIPFEVARRLRV